MYIVTTVLLFIVDICYAQMSGKGDSTYDKLFPEINQLIFQCYAAGFSSPTLILTLDIQKTCVEINSGDYYSEAMTRPTTKYYLVEEKDFPPSFINPIPLQVIDFNDVNSFNSYDYDKPDCTIPENYFNVHLCGSTEWKNMYLRNRMNRINNYIRDVSVCCAFKHSSHEAQELHLECYYSGTQIASTRYEFIGQMSKTNHPTILNRANQCLQQNSHDYNSENITLKYCYERPESGCVNSLVNASSAAEIKVLAGVAELEVNGTVSIQPKVRYAVCVYNPGTLTRVPALRVCIVSVEKGFHAMLQIQEQCAALMDSHANIKVVENSANCTQGTDVELFQAKAIAWFVLKLNYFVLCVCVLIILLLLLYIRNKPEYRFSKRFIYFITLVTLLWLMWRTQETFHMETKYQYSTPYLCIVMNDLDLIIEAQSYYLIVCTTLNRYKAIMIPVKWKAFNQSKKLKVIASLVGLGVGMLTSILNTFVLFINDDFNLIKTCQLTLDLSVLKVGFLIAVKILTIILLIAIPCLFITFTNFMVAFQINSCKKQKLQRNVTTSSENGKDNRVKRTTAYLILSTIFVLFTLPQPVFDLKLAVQMLLYDKNMELSVWEIIAEPICIHLTTFAFVLNTYVVIKYTA